MVNKYESLIQQIVDKGYGIEDHFLPKEVCRILYSLLIQRFEEGEMRLAGIGKGDLHQNNRVIRNDFISWIDEDKAEDAESIYFSIVQDFMAYLNRTCFTSLNNFEFHYALYQTGSFYKRHIDRFLSDDSRQFSMITYLNEEWSNEDGGALILYTDEGEVTILPQGNRVVFFRADEIEHEVKPALRDRMSITGWLKA